MVQRLEVGAAAPELSLSTAGGERVSLSDYRGRKVIVYFYPKAFTPGCTTEACDFRDNLASLRGQGYEVLGVSADPVERLAEFAEAEQLPFPLLSDPDAETAKAWGSWGDKVLPDGKEITGVLRSTFVVDEAGALELAEYNVPAEGHVRALRERLGV
ncbi:thioredoxin-dependent thiol peroxidase [Gulosibacter sp. 10]|uniref:thioredoxin-dependent thiol peroxidase n=1 Tax=Gulosibacter sp. 10 TaxID=1255570 RepID=UPI00097F3A5C|nr:thioredoxin-dependent thiol peroxidase [Gulosibacter sp. 10]SJM69550.1 Thiol peroxidase, Bcp-type [Gulosibacter sp. 10]